MAAFGVTCYIDGAARGNPGPAAIGVAIYLDAVETSGQPAVAWGEVLGEATNNVAEYRALLAAMERSRALGAEAVLVRSDSQLLIRQMTGLYRVRQPHLGLLHRQAKRLEAAFRSVGYEHVPRESNTLADRLANDALDAASLR
jgi:ribonuclease HI